MQKIMKGYVFRLYPYNKQIEYKSKLKNKKFYHIYEECIKLTASQLNFDLLIYAW